MALTKIARVVELSPDDADSAIVRYEPRLVDDGIAAAHETDGLGRREKQGDQLLETDEADLHVACQRRNLTGNLDPSTLEQRRGE